VLRERLAELGFRCWPSGGNFLLVALPGGTAADWAHALRELGVQVRPFGALPRLGECIRVSVGPWPMLDRFLVALAQVRADRNDNRDVK
jgi:histidinol-phosphate aminotransferase